jgi:hypothetical protein
MDRTSIIPDHGDITGYILSEDDRLIDNPYLAEIIEIVDILRKSGKVDVQMELLKHRQDFITKYAFSIPLYPFLSIIKEYSPIVELGAGTGYWAWCLRQMGVDITAFDRLPPGETDPWLWYEGNRWFNDSWFNISEGDERVLSAYPVHSLLLIWPEIHDPMAFRALKVYREAGGRILIYIGDPGSSGGKDFHDTLREFRKILEMEMPSWPGINERLFVYNLG